MNHAKGIFMAVAMVLILGAGSAWCQPGQPATNARQEIHLAVHVAAQGLGGVLANIDSAGARVEAIRDFVDAVRFFSDESGYFFVYDYGCVNIAHAVQKDLVGRNLTDFRDKAGAYVIRELSATARKGGGYVTYYWEKPGAADIHEKLGYVEPIPGTDYFIGTGVY